MADRIGDFLVRTGVMSQQQVDDVLRRQKAGDKKPFGEIAIELKYIPDSGAIDLFLDYQEKQLGD
jgi:hypothetical protein